MHNIIRPYMYEIARTLDWSRSLKKSISELLLVNRVLSVVEFFFYLAVNVTCLYIVAVVRPLSLSLSGKYSRVCVRMCIFMTHRSLPPYFSLSCQNCQRFLERFASLPLSLSILNTVIYLYIGTVLHQQISVSRNGTIVIVLVWEFSLSLTRSELSLAERTFQREAGPSEAAVGFLSLPHLYIDN